MSAAQRLSTAVQIEQGLDRRRRGPGITTLSPVSGDESPWMTEPQASSYTGFTPQALRQMRFLGKGPAYSKPAGRIRYHRDDLDTFMASGRRAS